MITFEIDKHQQQGILHSTSLSIIREHFSVANPSYNHRSSKFSYIPKRIYALTPAGKFDIGLYKEIACFLQQEGYTFDSSRIKSVTLPTLPCNVATLSLSLRDYQKEAVQICLDKGRGVVVLPTGAGKTLTIATLCQSVYDTYQNFKFLIIVPTIQLINQTYTDLLEYGIDKDILTKWSGDDIPNLSCNIIIAGLQILQSQYLNYTEFLNSINIIIIDECHKLRRQNEFNKILKHIKTPNRFGFTGTMPPDIADQWNIIGKIGPVLYERQSIELRQNKQIANISIQILVFNYLTKPAISSPTSTSPTKAFEEEINFLIHSNNRNKKIATICKNTDKNTLVIVERISHGELLYNTVTNLCTDKKVFFIQGSIDVSVREEIRNLMEKEHNIICIAISKIFAEGINIKNLHYIVFAASGKAKIKILQTIGRGVRLHPLKNMLHIFDIADNLRYGNKHLKERIKLYDTEKIPHKTTEIQV